MGEAQITVDCDVLQADGGTRTASICGGYVALHDACSRLVAETLQRKGIENGSEREGAYAFQTTGDPEWFREMGRRFLQLPVGDVEHVELRSLLREETHA
jgi:hypothetical protein